MSQDTQPRQLVIFTLGLEQYALPIGRVQEIIRYQQPRSLVSDHSSVCGVIKLRGQIVPVHDLAALLAIDAQTAETDKIMVLESEEQTVGVIVDSVDEVLTISENQLERAPATTDTALIESIAKIGERLVVLLNADAVTAGA